MNEKSYPSLTRAHARSTKEAENGEAPAPTEKPGQQWIHPTGKSPRSINLIALGPTSNDYHAAQCAYDPVIPQADETWTVNKGFRSIAADLVFIMDDLVGERIRSERYYQDIMNLKIPVLTSILDAETRAQYVGAYLFRYPIEQLIDWYGLRFLQLHGTPAGEGYRRFSSLMDWNATGAAEKVERGQFPADKIRTSGKQCAGYLKNSVPLMLAYAGFIGVKVINLFGADYDFPGQTIHEADKPNAEYWCGLLIGMLGMEIKVSTRTTLLSTNQGRSIYGYGARQPKL